MPTAIKIILSVAEKKQLEKNIKSRKTPVRLLRRISRELSPKVKNYAANFFCFSGLSKTSSTLSQFRISPLQRSGCRNFAC